MQRKKKNIIAIVIILLLCGSIVFTDYLSNKSFNTNNSNNMPNMSENGNQPPEMPTIASLLYEVWQSPKITFLR